MFGKLQIEPNPVIPLETTASLESTNMFDSPVSIYIHSAWNLYGLFRICLYNAFL